MSPAYVPSAEFEELLRGREIGVRRWTLVNDERRA
jgi:hypothetical protein